MPLDPWVHPSIAALFSAHAYATPIHTRDCLPSRAMQSYAMFPRARLIACLAVMGIASPACTQEGDSDPGAAESPSTASVKTQSVADTASGIRFKLAFPYLRATTEHFDPSLPAHKMRHVVTVRALTTTVLRVDVWDNPEGLSLQEWFDQHLAYSVTEGCAVTRRPVGAASSEAIVVDQPRSPQADPKRIATFASGQRIFRVTCFDASDLESVKAFDEALSTFDGEVTR